MLDVYIDIETIPGQSELAKEIAAETLEKKVASIKVPGTYKKPESIEQYKANETAKLIEAADQEYRKQALNGTLGEVIAVGLYSPQIDNEPTVYVRPQGDSESSLLLDACEHLARYSKGGHPFTWIGHNVTWDIRFLWQRTRLNRIQTQFPIPVNAAPWSDAVYDTMTRWAGIKDRVSLDMLCQVFGLKQKGDFDGSKVYDAWLNEEYEKIGSYCLDDVERVVRLHELMK